MPLRTFLSVLAPPSHTRSVLGRAPKDVLPFTFVLFRTQQGTSYSVDYDKTSIYSISTNPNLFAASSLSGVVSTM